MADANQLELAILNLAMNARDATVDGGTIKIAARAVDGPRIRSCRPEAGERPAPLTTPPTTAMVRGKTGKDHRCPPITTF